MNDSDTYYEALHRAIAALRLQLTLMPHDDPRRDRLYRNLLWCYHEALALVRRRIAAYRVACGPEALSPRLCEICAPHSALLPSAGRVDTRWQQMSTRRAVHRVSSYVWPAQ
jgi:hypothetical protein